MVLTGPPRRIPNPKILAKTANLDGLLSGQGVGQEDTPSAPWLRECVISSGKKQTFPAGRKGT